MLPEGSGNYPQHVATIDVFDPCSRFERTPTYDRQTGYN